MLREAEDHEEGLNGDLDDCLADEGGAEEHTEGDQEVTAEEASEVEEWVRYRGKEEDRDEGVLLEGLIDPHLRALHEALAATAHCALVEHLCELLMLTACETCRACHIVGWQLADSGS